MQRIHLVRPGQIGMDMDQTSLRVDVLEIECQCTLNGEYYDFCYRLPPEEQVKGRRFDCEHTHDLERLDLLSDKNALNFEQQALPEPPFVTAMSDNHFKEGRTLKMCQLEVRRFSFDSYPTYVRNLGEYRWKPLIIAETLKEFGAAWYMNTSVRWKKDKLNEVHSELTCQKKHPRTE
ncbi:hypothetical protein ANCDUO_04943 [Ancylostoma duodenale]|uniref:Uncharacterized protein n=1 Tax=Ancylostoma duodenale TaxID=51022 RepID=A0A0C2D593_9BILA|nr:hypothetical protein ANCDUO_04943 [Ancylostoma duodenale]